MNKYNYTEVLELNKKMELIQDLNYKIDNLNMELLKMNINDEFIKDFFNITHDYKKKLFDYRESLILDIIPFLHFCKIELQKKESDKNDNIY